MRTHKNNFRLFKKFCLIIRISERKAFEILFSLNSHKSEFFLSFTMLSGTWTPINRVGAWCSKLDLSVALNIKLGKSGIPLQIAVLRISYFWWFAQAVKMNRITVGDNRYLINLLPRKTCRILLQAYFCFRSNLCLDSTLC